MIRTCVTTEDVSIERRADIRLLLVERQRDLLKDIQVWVRDAREEGVGTCRHATDADDTGEAELEDDLRFALINMKGELLETITEAIRRCDDRSYGYCIDCGDAIASSRLRAMPSAVRCRDCEATREAARQRERVQWQRVPSRRELRF
jgi:RNA polymerase-binding transcription factor